MNIEQAAERVEKALNNLNAAIEKASAPRRKGPRIPGDGDGDGIPYEGKNKGSGAPARSPLLPGVKTPKPQPKADADHKLEGVEVWTKPKVVSGPISAKNVSWRTGYSKEPEPKPNDRGSFVFDSAIGSFADHGKNGATFKVGGYGTTWAQAKQKAAQQAAAWGHNQLRMAP